MKLRRARHTRKECQLFIGLNSHRKSSALFSDNPTGVYSSSIRILTLHTFVKYFDIPKRTMIILLMLKHVLHAL